MLHVWLRPNAKQMLLPVSSMDRALVAKLHVDKRVLAKISQPRNLKHHNKFFAILAAAYDQQERFRNHDRFRAYVMVKAGYAKSWESPSESISPRLLLGIYSMAPHVFAEPMENGTGVILYAPKSLKFEEMDQQEFDGFYQRALDVLAKDFGLDVEKLERDGSGL